MWNIIKIIFYWPPLDRWNFKEGENRKRGNFGNCHVEIFRKQTDPYRRVRNYLRKINIRRESLLQVVRLRLQTSDVPVSIFNANLYCLIEWVWLEHGLPTDMPVQRVVGMSASYFWKCLIINAIHTGYKANSDISILLFVSLNSSNCI